MKIELEELKVSASALKTYESCPRKYYFSYIKKLPKKKWPHTELGNFVHNVLEAFHNQMRDNPLPASEWPGLLRSLCAKQLSENPLTPEQRASAKNMLATYLDKIRETGLPNVLFNEKGFSVKLPDNVLIRGFIDRIDREGELLHIVDYKGLALDTPIPTPTGWTTMGELQVGDMVVGFDGQPTKVLVKSKVYNRPCYRIVLTDHSSVVCDNVHLWQVEIDGSTRVVSADELYEEYKSGATLSFKPAKSSPNHQIRLQKPREIDEMYEVPSVPTQCIQIDAIDSLYLCGETYWPTHNSGKSKYLDEFQLVIYALALMAEDPSITRVKGSYLALAEGCKTIPYSISKTDVDRCRDEIVKISNQIRSDQTWETRPTRLCNYCDFKEVCPAMAAEPPEWGSFSGGE